MQKRECSCATQKSIVSDCLAADRKDAEDRPAAPETMGAGASHNYQSVEEAIHAGVSTEDLLANGVTQAEIDFLTWNDIDDKHRRGSRPCQPSMVRTHRRR